MWLSFPSQPIINSEMIWCLTPKLLSTVETPTNSPWLAKNAYSMAVPPGNFLLWEMKLLAKPVKDLLDILLLTKWDFQQMSGELKSHHYSVFSLCWFYNLSLVTNHTFPPRVPVFSRNDNTSGSSVLTHMPLPSGLDVSIMNVYLSWHSPLPCLLFKPSVSLGVGVPFHDNAMMAFHYIIIQRSSPQNPGKSWKISFLFLAYLQCAVSKDPFSTSF